MSMGLRHLNLYAVTLCGALLTSSACGPITLDPRKSEFWLGGTNDKEIREHARPIVDSATVEVERFRDDFLSCMRRYGFEHVSAKATASEIAEGGLSACSVPLNSFNRAFEVMAEYSWYIALGANPSRSRGPTEGHRQSDQATSELVAIGRRAAIKAVIDGQR